MKLSGTVFAVIISSFGFAYEGPDTESQDLSEDRYANILNIWQCSSCGTVNSGFNIYCSACGAHRDGEIEEEDDFSADP